MLREKDVRQVCYIVTCCGGEWSDAYEIPEYVFLDKEVAEDLARKLNERHVALREESQGAYDEWCERHEDDEEWPDGDVDPMPDVPDPEWWVVHAAVFSGFRRPE